MRAQRTTTGKLHSGKFVSYLRVSTERQGSSALRRSVPLAA